MTYIKKLANRIEDKRFLSIAVSTGIILMVISAIQTKYFPEDVSNFEQIATVIAGAISLSYANMLVARIKKMGSISKRITAIVLVGSMYSSFLIFFYLFMKTY